MAIEFEQAPDCCRKSLERVHDILDAGQYLVEILAVAPTLTKPRPRIGVLGILWGLGTGVWSWRRNRRLTGKLMDPIIQNRVNTVIDFEIVQHSRSNERELEKHWTQIREEFKR
jgi:hypothetical protein